MTPTSRFGSNIFFNNRHSLGAPIVSIVGMPLVGICRPPGRPGIAGIGACMVGETTGCAKGAAPRPVLLTGMPTEPVILQIKERYVCQQDDL